MRRRNEIALYAPWAKAFYEREAPEPERGGGGAEVQMTQLARALGESGLKVAHIVFPVDDPLLGERDPVLIERTLPHHGIGPLGSLAEPFRIWGAMMRARARIYVFRGSGRHVVAALIFCRVMRRKLVFSGSNDFDFAEERPSYSRRSVALYRWAIGRTDAIVTQSEQQLELARRSFPKVEPIVTIPSFAQPTEPAGERPEAFLWVGRLVDYKRPLRYVELAAALPESHFRMVCVHKTGGGSQELWEELAARAERLPNLELLQSRPRRELMSLVERAVAIVSTSEHEGMPNVFLEGWGRGIPAVSLSFDPDGRIEQRELGICAGGSWEGFVEAAARLWEDDGLRAELGANARAYLRGVHYPAVVARRWLELIRELLGP